MEAELIIQKLHAYVLSKPEKFSVFDCTVKFTIDNVKSWIFILKETLSVQQSDHDADVEIFMSKSTFQSLTSEHQNAQAAFREGKISVRGDTILAMRAVEILEGFR
ncbi:MAG: SCP2 sterol-binding domain-containing protein [Deltaproteobacteria bacterium]|nr:SCP2 sterol-binding domain-containing protein [Deltaproteobacteria bacterium]